MQVDLKTLIGKLNRTCRKGLEGAAALCVSQTHYNVEIGDLSPEQESSEQFVWLNHTHRELETQLTRSG